MRDYQSVRISKVTLRMSMRDYQSVAGTSVENSIGGSYSPSDKTDSKCHYKFRGDRRKNQAFRKFKISLLITLLNTSLVRKPKIYTLFLCTSIYF